MTCLASGSCWAPGTQLYIHHLDLLFKNMYYSGRVELSTGYSNFRDWKVLRDLVQAPTMDQNTFCSVFNRKCSGLWELPGKEPISLKISHTLRRSQNIASLLTAVLGHCKDEWEFWFVGREKIQLFGIRWEGANWGDIWKGPGSLSAILAFRNVEKTPGSMNEGHTVWVEGWRKKIKKYYILKMCPENRYA